MSEKPDTVHGRLMAYADVTKYSFEKAMASLEWLLEDGRWRECGFGRIDDFVETLRLKPYWDTVGQRKKIVALLAEVRDGEKATQRTIASAVGVTHPTVRSDLGLGKNLPQEEPMLHVDEPVIVFGKNIPSPPSTITRDGDEFIATQAKKDEKAIAYGHGDIGDEWYTPPWLFDSLGLRFAIDVCAPEQPDRRTAPADRYFIPATDGLAEKWEGLVWCNPPYSNPEPWALHCIKHDDGLLLTHVPMNAAWCAEVWRACRGIRLFQAIEFLRPDGTLQRPGMWLQLAAFGETAAMALGQMQIPEMIASNPRRIPSPMWTRYEG